MLHSSRILLYSVQIQLYSQENPVLLILKRDTVSQTLKDYFIIDQNLPVFIPESYTSIEKYIKLKSELDNLFSSLKYGVKAF